MVQFAWLSARLDRLVRHEARHDDSTVPATVNHRTRELADGLILLSSSLAENLRKTSIRRGSTSLLTASPNMSQHGISGSDTLKKQGRKLG
jgi:hypothetical protein